MMHFNRFAAALAVVGLVMNSARVYATPYASGVTKTGTTVSFILNEPTDTLKYTINNGAPVTLDGTTKGTKTFSLSNASDVFSIIAEKNAATGFLIPTGGTIAGIANGPRVDSPQSGTNLVSDDASVFSRYASPRGVDTVRNPNSPYFGNVYISNSNAGTNTGGNVIGPGATPPNAVRTTGDGLYALHADESDAFGNGDVPVNPINIDSFAAFNTGTSGANSPYRLTVGSDGFLYVTDYSDINGQLFRVDPNISIANGAGTNQTAVNVFAGFGGPFTPAGPDGTALPAGQNHGSISSVYTTGSLATNDLVVYAVDEDLNSAHVQNDTTKPQNDRNSLWKWTVGGTVGNFSAMPTQITAGVVTNPTPFPAYVPGLIGDFPAGGIVVDMVHGPDGKFYLGQNRSAGNQDGLIVTDPTGAIIWDSIATSRTILGDPNAADILTGVGGIDISPDGKYLAIIQIDNDVTLLPLVNGVPDLANRLVMDGGTNTGNGRDIAFDAAGNIYTLSSGQAMMREYAPGGHTIATLTWNGTSYSFASQLVAGLTGDYNGDGKVDAADYVMWRKNPGNFGGDPAGYTAWRNSFGLPGSGAGLGGAAVPEPSTLAILALGLVASAGFRRRKLEIQG